MTMTETETMPQTFTKGDRVRLIDAGGNGSSTAQVGDEGVVTSANTYVGLEKDGPLVTVRFDSGEESVRFARRYKKVEAEIITVLDRAGVKALPVGTELRDRDGDRLVVRADGQADWYSKGNPDFVIGPIPNAAEYAPLVVLNPEILGEFKPLPEPLALWEKELLNIFEKDEIVEIIGVDAATTDSGFDVEPWAGLRCVVVRDNKGEDMAYVRPLTDRPDGCKRTEFYWDSVGLVRTNQFEVGDRVRVNDNMVYEEGAEGHIISLAPFSSGDDVMVRITDPVQDMEEGEELAYTFDSLILVKTATQVEHEKAVQEEAARAEQAATFTEGATFRLIGNTEGNPAGHHNLVADSIVTVLGYEPDYSSTLGKAPVVNVKGTSRHGGYELTQRVLPVDLEAAQPEPRDLKVGDTVETFEELELLPRGSVIIFEDDPVSPMVKTGYGTGSWSRINRYWKGTFGQEGDRIAMGTVYNSTEKVRDAIELDSKVITVIHVPA